LAPRACFFSVLRSAAVSTTGAVCGGIQAAGHRRVHPVGHPLLHEMLGFVPPEPSRTMLDLVDVWTAEHTLTT